jgi:hypothetical protein
MKRHQLIYEDGLQPSTEEMRRTLSEAYAIRRSLLRLISILPYKRLQGTFIRRVNGREFII